MILDFEINNLDHAPIAEAMEIDYENEKTHSPPVSILDI